VADLTWGTRDGGGPAEDTPNACMATIYPSPFGVRHGRRNLGWTTWDLGDPVADMTGQGRTRTAGGDRNGYVAPLQHRRHVKVAAIGIVHHVHPGPPGAALLKDAERFGEAAEVGAGDRLGVVPPVLARRLRPAFRWPRPWNPSIASSR